MLSFYNIDRFNQFQYNPILGLYNLDLLNTIVQIIFTPSFFALYAAHRNVNNALALLLSAAGEAMLAKGDISHSKMNKTHNSHLC